MAWIAFTIFGKGVGIRVVVRWVVVGFVGGGPQIKSEMITWKYISSNTILHLATGIRNILIIMINDNSVAITL